MIDDTSKDYITSLARGLEVLACFNDSAKSMTPADIANQTGLTRATARRALLTLEALGYMSSDGKNFSLTPKVLALSQAYLSSTKISSHILAIVRNAAMAVNETCSFGIRDGNEVVIVARHFSSHIQNLLIEIGTRLPLEVTALGRIILSGLPENELEAHLEKKELQPLTPKTVLNKDKLKRLIVDGGENGYVIVDGELSPGSMSIAVPVMKENGEIYGAINFGGTSARFEHVNIDEKILPVLRNAAASIEQLII